MATLTYKLTETDTKFQTEIKNLVESTHSYDTKALYGKIQIGLKLVAIKKETKVNFYNVILESILSKKTVQRYMKLVLLSNVDFKQAMKITGTAKEITKNVELLVLDTRFTKLTENDISEISDCSFSKLSTMKDLTTTNWNYVLKGKNKSYETLTAKIKNDTKTAADKKRDKNQPKGMDKQRFLDMVENGIFPAIKTVYDFQMKNTELEKSIKVLARKVESLKKINNDSLQKIASLNGELKGMNMFNAKAYVTQGETA